MHERSNEHTDTPPADKFSGVNERGSWGAEMNLTARIAIYLRVSTKEQNVDNQLPMIETYLRANFPKFESFGDSSQNFHLFWDHESGKTADRKAWGLLFNRMQKQCYDHIIVWHVDRVSRNIEQFSAMLRIARAARCTMHFVSLNLRSDSPMMEFMAKFFCLWAEHEVALKEMRQKEGIARRRAQGKPMGRQPDMTRDVELFELLRENPDLSIAGVARHFNKGRSWAKTAIKRVSERSPPHDE